MASYSKTDKFLHRFYLSNYGISKATLEMEEIINGSKIKDLHVDQSVFVTGLARSGTTAVMRKIYSSGLYASLQYANMPFLLCPNLWNKVSKIESHERAHKDGIVIDGNSPEEFDEFFWKAFLNDSYIVADGLKPHSPDDEIIKKYQTYIALICLAKKKNRYISKNNNNILRISTLEKLENSKIILLFRHPLSHASSLMKLDKNFSKDHSEDPFNLEYFNFLGHHEFGLNHKPFLLTNRFEIDRTKYARNSINYWLSIWLNYYSYVLENKDESHLMVCFEDLIESPNDNYKRIASFLGYNFSEEPSKPFKPTEYKKAECDTELMDQCMEVYNALKSSN